MNEVPQSQSPEDVLRLKRALLALQKMQARVDALESARTEPIAVIGMGCRFPGAGSPQEFWSLLQRGVDAITEIPRERWDSSVYYDPNPQAAGKIATRHGGFLENVDLFDAHFFG